MPKFFTLRDCKTRSIYVSIDFFIISRDAYKTVSQIVTRYLKAEAMCIQIHLVVEQDGIESIFLRIVLRAQPSAAICQFSIERTCIFPGCQTGMLKIKVHQMLIAPEHLIAEFSLT